VPRLINWDIARNPYNWIVVALMVAIPVIAFTMFDPLGAKGNT
jgi:hypothetical protein